MKRMPGVLCASVIPCALVVGWGPSHNLRQAWALCKKIKGSCTPTMQWGDGASESEEWHRANGKNWGVPTTPRRR